MIEEGILALTVPEIVFDIAYGLESWKRGLAFSDRDCDRATVSLMVMWLE